jgi:hypothetical protein
MKILGSVVSVLLGVGLMALGLLFLVGAAGRGSRYLVAAVGLALGGGLCALGAWLFKKVKASSPDQLEADILALAKREDGEVSLAEIAAQLGPRFELGTRQLSRMVDLGLCKRQDRGGQPYYVFAHLQPRLMVIRCEFCQAELPLNEPVDTCPRCGGSVASKVETKAASDDYSMD